jgi:hypothetical protein
MNESQMDQSQNSEDASFSRKRRTVHKGLDGGYWSTLQMSSITDPVPTKRTRTTVERLEASYLPLIAMSSNTSITDRGNESRSSRQRTNKGTASADTSMRSRSDNDSPRPPQLSFAKKLLPPPPTASSSNQVDLSIDENSTHSNSTQGTSASGNKNRNRDRSILFKSHSFLAVRNDEGSFFLCLALTNIYEDSKQSKIQWLEDVEPPTVYKLGQVDWLDPLSAICRVHVRRIGENRLELDKDDLGKVSNLLIKAIEEGGITGESSTEFENDNNDINENDDSDEEAAVKGGVLQEKKKEQKLITKMKKIGFYTSSEKSRKIATDKLKKLIQDEDCFDKEESSNDKSYDRKNKVCFITVFFRIGTLRIFNFVFFRKRFMCRRSRD